jgi:hypothetical protein
MVRETRGEAMMTAYWNLSKESAGLVLTAEAMFEGDADVGWRGQVTTVPFGGRVTRGAALGQVRERLARIVLAQVNGGELPLPPGLVSAIRLMSVTTTYYPRGEMGGPAIVVPAVADRDGSTWSVMTAATAGLLARQAAAGATISDARDALAEGFLLALEVGIDGLPQEWSGIRLYTLTRKTYPVAQLSAG